ncbi:MAG: thiamine-binding protein [Winogradskyella sp.]|nr:thiamine-binding protein [Winogradskyella sp.]NNF86151.1 hypothetical protein [Winogradskyella sp.]
MNISVELTFLPLTDKFETHIIAFIKRLKASGFNVLENPLSTQIYGDYEEVMHFLSTEIKQSFEAIEMGVFNVKIVKTDRSGYQSNF